MEDTRQWFACEYCDGEFSVETDCSMDILYCVFCSEPLDTLQDGEPEDYYEEV
jgi:hypothetical protein